MLTKRVCNKILHERGLKDLEITRFCQSEDIYKMELSRDSNPVIYLRFDFPNKEFVFYEDKNFTREPLTPFRKKIKQELDEAQCFRRMAAWAAYNRQIYITISEIEIRDFLIENVYEDK